MLGRDLILHTGLHGSGYVASAGQIHILGTNTSLAAELFKTTFSTHSSDICITKCTARFNPCSQLGLLGRNIVCPRRDPNSTPFVRSFLSFLPLSSLPPPPPAPRGRHHHHQRGCPHQPPTATSRLGTVRPTERPTCKQRLRNAAEQSELQLAIIAR